MPLDQQVKTGKKVVLPKPVDEAARSSKVFSMAQWQTQMNSQVRAMAEAYHAKVTLKVEAAKQYQKLSNQLQGKVIELVETQSMYS